MAFDRVVSRGIRGSCTALVCILRGNVLEVANLGDSGLIILRPGPAPLAGVIDYPTKETAGECEKPFDYDKMCKPKSDQGLLKFGKGRRLEKTVQDLTVASDSARTFHVVFRTKEQLRTLQAVKVHFLLKTLLKYFLDKVSKRCGPPLLLLQL